MTFLGSEQVQLATKSLFHTFLKIESFFTFHGNIAQKFIVLGS